MEYLTGMRRQSLVGTSNKKSHRVEQCNISQGGEEKSRSDEQQESHRDEQRTRGEHEYKTRLVIKSSCTIQQ